MVAADVGARNVGRMLVVGPAQLEPHVVGAARSLAGRGIAAGDRVGIVTPEQHDRGNAEPGQAAAIATVIACLRTGVTPVMVHPLLTQHERAYIAVDCGASLLLSGADELLAFTATTDGPVPELSPTFLGRPMHYTSGTTGAPKGVFARLTPGRAAAYWDDEIGHWGFEPGDLTLVHSPLCHSAPLRFAIGTLAAGGSVALAGKFDPAVIAAAMTDCRPTTAFVVPAHLQQLLDLPGGPPPAPYRTLVHAGSACPAEVKRATHAWLGAERVVEFYSSTEGHFTTCRGPEWEAHPGTVGRARSGRTISIGTGGTIWCEPPDYARFEYWNAPAKTAAAWRDTPTGREFTVGDLGRIDDDGYLFLDGRREDLIITGGVNVYPAEVEHIVRECPGVADVVVYGVADDRWGQAVCACYVGSAAPGTVRGWCAQRLAAFKRPKRWARLDELPRNTMGKIVRTELPGVTDR